MNRREFIKNTIFTIVGTTLIGIKFNAKDYPKNEIIPFNIRPYRITAIEKIDEENTTLWCPTTEEQRLRKYKYIRSINSRHELSFSVEPQTIPMIEVLDEIIITYEDNNKKWTKIFLVTKIEELPA